MGSMVEVLHHFPDYNMVDQSQPPSHQPSEQSRPPKDVIMTDVASPPSASISSTLSTSSTSSRLRSRSHPLPQQQQQHSSYKSDLAIRESPINSFAATSGSSNIAHMLPLLSSTSSPNSLSTVTDTQSHQSAAQSPPSPPRIKVKSLSHIQSFVIDDQNPLSSSRIPSRLSLSGKLDFPPQYEISEMPVSEVIEMVAGLLTKITSTNDRQHEYVNSSAINDSTPSTNATANANANTNTSSSSSSSSQTSSVLAFHGKNVPTISILSYLSRIHKYCPTTYEVFLSLLVYFDRMTESVNAGPLSLRQANQQSLEVQALQCSQSQSQTQSHSHSHSQSQTKTQASEGTDSPQHTNNSLVLASNNTTPPNLGSILADDLPSTTGNSATSEAPPSPPNAIYSGPIQDAASLAHFFVVDSFNIHRLVIAGVTCASKFFSDVFYTNSRYAKVGGLPLAELNHLEIQFLLLNDFRLAVPLEEMEAYGTMLVEFYAREVLTQQQSSSIRMHPMSE